MKPEIKKGCTVRLKKELAGGLDDTGTVIGVVTDQGPDPKTWVSMRWDSFGAFVPISVFAAENLEVV